MVCLALCAQTSIPTVFSAILTPPVLTVLKDIPFYLMDLHVSFNVPASILTALHAKPTFALNVMKGMR